MPDQGTRYLLYKYATLNLGDEVQSIAAERFLPRVDRFVDRDQLNIELNAYRKEDLGSLKLIANGWYSHNPSAFFPDREKRDFKPLLISMHLASEWGSSIEEMFKAEGFLDFMRSNAPVGCRDLSTMKVLEEHGIDAYFSGCLTLTLQRNDSIKRENFIALSDVTAPANPAGLEDHPLVEVRHLTQFSRFSGTLLRRLNLINLRKRRLARSLLNTFERAKLVVTSRLHCVLPCIALSTPVVFVHPNPSDPRFQGLEGILNVISPETYSQLNTFEELLEARCKAPDRDRIRGDLEARVTSYLEI
jgi:hypothetical protein